MYYEKEINIKKVNKDAFIDALIDAEVDVTPSDLIELSDLFND